MIVAGQDRGHQGPFNNKERPVQEAKSYQTEVCGAESSCTESEDRVHLKLPRKRYLEHVSELSCSFLVSARGLS